MSSEQKKQYGVTPAVSHRGATPFQIQCDTAIRSFLRPFAVLDTSDGQRERERILTTLYDLLVDWISEEYRALGHDMEDEDDLLHGGDILLLKFCTFGSYRLGVNAANGDIDVLCLGPRRVSRDRFFDVVGNKLQTTPGVTNVVLVRGASVPLITMSFDGVDIDLVYAPLALDCIHASLCLLDDRTILALDEQTQRCINGSRVTDLILQLVPNPGTFRETLVFLKFWANQRKIYSNVLGFLGGISWALLTARVCQLYPNASPSLLLLKFFELFGLRWEWPDPVLLTDIYTRPRPNGSDYRVWDPRKHRTDERDLMPIITPAFPAMNSTYNVTQSTFRILKQELRRGQVIMETIVARQQIQIQRGLVELCQPSTFLADYKHYLRLVLTSESVEHAMAWKGFIQSKLRVLILYLDQQLAAEACFHPYSEVMHEPGTTQDTFLIGIRVLGATVLDMSEPLERFRKLLHWDGQSADMELRIESVTGKALRRSRTVNKT